MSQNERGSDGESGSLALLVSSRDYFCEAVDDALAQRRLKASAKARDYLIDLLGLYMDASNLFDETDESGRRTRATLAETFLRATSADAQTRVELLKKLGDRSLYISGFFGDSLQRKIVDVDYYADMGGTAYATLADYVREDTVARMYREFSERFIEFVDVLAFISSRAIVKPEENIMRLYENYEKTGSSLAREKLLEMGLIAVPRQGAAKKQ